MRLLLLLGLVLVAGTAFHDGAAADIDAWRERFRSVTPRTFDLGGAVGRQFHLDAAAYLEMATLARTGPARPLPMAPRPEIGATEVRLPEGSAPFAAYVEQDPFVDAVLVLHRGRIVFEAYPRMAPWQRHFAWSVSKVLASTALGALVRTGRVDPERDVAAYLPELRGTAWAGTALRDVANMASGIDCLDADGYQTPTTCIYRLEEALGITAPTGYDEGLLAHLQAMSRRGPPGVRNEYVSANTVVLGLVLEAVTGQPFARAVQDLLWGPMGAEADGLMAISPEGFAYTSSGLHLRLRDLARFGALYTEPEASGVLDAAFLADVRGPEGIALSDAQRIRLAEDFPGDVPVRAAWQWDLVWEDGALYKGGYSGQGLYVDPARALVIAWFGTGEDYGARRNALRSVARQLATSGLFDPDGRPRSTGSPRPRAPEPDPRHDVAHAFGATSRKRSAGRLHGPAFRPLSLEPNGVRPMTLLQTAAQLFLSRLDGASQGLDEAKVADGLSSLLPTAGGDLDVQALVGQFTGAGGGIAQLAQSWLGNGGNLAISREQIEAVLGGGAIGAFAQRLGLDGEKATSGLAAMLPELVDRISTDGALRSDVLGAVGRGILGKLF